MHVIDLRSDAITRPTAAMWEAIRQAQLGWALVGEDVSVNELEAYAADLVGKEAALFVPTGSMANLIALMSHTQRGEQVILEASSHILWSEEWGFAYICGVVPRPITGALGYMNPDKIEAVIQDQKFSHQPRTSLICLENTHNAAGGTILSDVQIAAMANVAHKYRIPVHLDGIRLFNACIALDKSPRELVKYVDTVAIGLNKGLSAPAGALLCGSKDFIELSQINLKRIGGRSIHQAGILAAAGLVALKTMPPQLAEDHRRAQLLAGKLAQVDGLQIDPKSVQTNIVMATLDKTLMSAAALIEQLAQRHIRVYLYTADTIRFVTHRHISDDDIDRVVTQIKFILQQA